MWLVNLFSMFVAWTKGERPDPIELIETLGWGFFVTGGLVAIWADGQIETIGIAAFAAGILLWLIAFAMAFYRGDGEASTDGWWPWD